MEGILLTKTGEVHNMEIKQNGSQRSAKGPVDYFTGTVRRNRRGSAARASRSNPAPEPHGTPTRLARLWL